MLWIVYGIYNNEEYFEEFERFDLNRFEEIMLFYVFVVFGGGLRVCVGY